MFTYTAKERENVDASGWIYVTAILFDSLQPTKKVTRLLILYHTLRGYTIHTRARVYYYYYYDLSVSFENCDQKWEGKEEKSSLGTMFFLPNPDQKMMMIHLLCEIRSP
jgi:hypothetical protein